MKLNRMLTMCAMTAALLLSTGSLLAQNDNGGNNNGGGQNGQNRRGNFDPAQIQQRIRDQLGFTNDTDWNAIQPLVQKVMDARMAVGFGGRGFGRGGRGGSQGGGGGGFGQPNPERDALQKLIDDNAPTSQIKDALAKYRTSQKSKQAKLVQAQEALRKVLTIKQEAQAAMLGLVD